MTNMYSLLLSSAPRYRYVGIYNNVFISSGVPLMNVQNAESSMTFMGNAYYPADGNFKITYAKVNYESLAAFQQSGQEMVCRIKMFSKFPHISPFDLDVYQCL